MLLSELLIKLEATEFPLSFLEFKEEEKPELPYIIYRIVNEKPTYAGGEVYFCFQVIEVVLYARYKQKSIEDTLRRALSGVPFRLQESEDRENGRYRYTLTLEVEKE